MEWEDLDAVVKTVPWAKAKITVNTDGKVRMHLTLSEPMLKDCGNPKQCDVQTGTQDGKVMVRLVFRAQGKFEVKPLELGGARIAAIAVKPPIPDGARDAETCELISKSLTEAVIALPLADWARQRQGPKPAVVAPVKVPEPPKSQPQTLDAANYLKGKGVKASRLAGDWWQIDGRRTPRMEVLARVNECRRAAGLASLGPDNID